MRVERYEVILSIVLTLRVARAYARAPSVRLFVQRVEAQTTDRQALRF